MNNPRTPSPSPEASTQVSSSKTLRQRIKNSHNHATQSATVLKRIVIASVAGVVLAGGALLYVTLTSQQRADSPDAKREAAKLVVENTTAPTPRSITSTLGFSVQYNSEQYSASGQVTDPKSDSSYISGMQYNGDELQQSREYSIVRIKNIADKDVLITQNPELSIITNIRKNYFDDRQKVAANQGKTNLEILTSDTVASHKDNGYALAKTTDLTINGVQYVQLQFENSNSSMGVNSTSIEHVYATVQNDRPYTITISSLDANNAASLSQYQAIIKTITYTPPDQSKLSATKGSATLASVDLPKSTTNVPNTLDEDTLISVVAKNQPAVVRIGTIRCADVTIKSVDSSVSKVLDNACSGGIGSGSFISSDGYIATNGHVTRVADSGLINDFVTMQDTSSAQSSRLKQLLTTLVATGYLSADNADSLVQGLNSGDQDAIAKVSNLGSLVPSAQLSFAHDEYQYVVQTSNDPIRFDHKSDGAVSWTRNKTNIKASYVDSNYDNSGTATPSEAMTSSQYSDVALLKATGAFPTIKLGSVSALQSGDKLTAIGYPAFVDGGTATTQTRTVPSATQGRVVRVLGDESNLTYKLIQTSVPIAQGNSGGPSFDVDGLAVGLNTYGSIDCPDHKCFGDGTVRDIADLKQLLRKNNVTLKTSSAISNTWNKGLSAMMAGEYATAKQSFESVRQQYPANYMAIKFLAIVTPKVNTAEDVTPTVDIVPIVLGAIGVFIVILIVTVILLIRHLLKGQKQSPLVYGQQAPVVIPTPMQQPIVAQPQPVAHSGLQSSDVSPASVVSEPSDLQQPTVPIGVRESMSVTNESGVVEGVAPVTAPAPAPQPDLAAAPTQPTHMMPLVQPAPYAAAMHRQNSAHPTTAVPPAADQPSQK